MGKFFKFVKSFFDFSGDNFMYATIVNANDGFALVERGTGTTIQTYARARDARRGATRRDLVLA